jgi:hypothetical protein
VHAWLLCGNVYDVNDLTDLDEVGRIILKWDFKKYDGLGVWTGLIWLRIGIGCGSLCPSDVSRSAGTVLAAVRKLVSYRVSKLISKLVSK